MWWPNGTQLTHAKGIRSAIRTTLARQFIFFSFTVKPLNFFCLLGLSGTRKCKQITVLKANNDEIMDEN